jgi:hypothetical protein
MMAQNVTADRDKYIGGSDVSAIMGLSPFKTRYQLLCEKAGLWTDDFQGNAYTEFGNIMERKIRDYINSTMPFNAQFEEGKVINGDIRCHTDGFNGHCVLEIKTTSCVHETAEEHKRYLVQLLLYMQENHVENGLLAVYQRDNTFDTEFDPAKLSVFEVSLSDYQSLMGEVNFEIDRFRKDLARLRENPLLCEEDFQPNEVVLLSNKVAVLENRMAEFREIEKQYKAMKQKLFDAMTEHNVKSWQTPNGTKITRVDGTEATTETVWEFDKDAFASENDELYRKYLKQVEKKKEGKSGYVRITMGGE